MNSICTECNQTFIIKDRSKPNKFCSSECYRTHRKKHAKSEYLYTHKCKHCENDFISSSTRKYCSRTCQIESNAIKYIESTSRQCIQCSQLFIPHKTNRSQRFCSKLCYWEFRNNNPDIIIQSNQEKKLIQQICKYCGAQYSIHPYRNSITQYCSRECHYNDGRSKIICRTCKQEFTAQRHIQKIYCSNKCASKGIEKRKSKFSKQVYKILSSKYSNIDTEFKIHDSTRSVWCDYIINDSIIVECYGDYWHCNPNKYHAEYYHSQIKKTAKEIWEYDTNRVNFINTHGYITICIWESDMKLAKFRDTLISKVENALCNL